MSKRKSTVWEYYEIDDEDKNGNRNAECKECKRKIKFYKTTTSSLHKHLKTHGIIINRIKKETKNTMVCLFCSKTVSAISSRTDHYKRFIKIFLLCFFITASNAVINNFIQTLRGRSRLTE